MSKKRKKMNQDGFGNITCSFCGKNQSEVKNLVAGPCVYICDECLDLCVEINEEKRIGVKTKTKTTGELKNPKSIHKCLDKHIVNQEHTKKMLSVAIYNHYKRIKNPELGIEKSNILLAGPSGSGKTLFAKTIASVLDVPFVITDATSLTEAGYVGEDVESILRRLYSAAGDDIDKAQRGVIVFIDEIDKLRKKAPNLSTTSDVGGEGVQQAILKLIEGANVRFTPGDGRKNPDAESIEIDTSNILFICGGAFVGLDISNVNGREKIESDALYKFGLIPELVGRLPIVCKLEPLSVNELKRILTEPENAIVKQYQRLFDLDGYDLTFDDAALEHITVEALRRQTGARGLRAVIEDFIIEILYEIPSDKKNNHCAIGADGSGLTFRLSKVERISKPKKEKKQKAIKNRSIRSA